MRIIVRELTLVYAKARNMLTMIDAPGKSHEEEEFLEALANGSESWFKRRDGNWGVL